MSNITKTKEIRTYELPQAVVDATLTGNWGSLHQDHRIMFIKQLCETLEIPLVMNPFLFINARGKIVLYAPASAYQMIANRQGISTEIKSAQIDKDLMLFEVNARAIATNGRFADNMAAISLKGLSGEDYANAKMKCVTKAQRRAIKALVGLPIPDEDDINAQHPGEIISLNIQEGTNDKTQTRTPEGIEEQDDPTYYDQRFEDLAPIAKIIPKIQAKEEKKEVHKAPAKQLTDDERLEIDQWKSHLRELFLSRKDSPFYGKARDAAQFAKNETGKELADMNAAEMEDLESRFYKRYPEMVVSSEQVEKNLRWTK
jgi:hypothetical protein